MNTITHTLLIGAGATAFIDAWALMRRRLLGTKLPDYALVGRWIGAMSRGRWRHESIAAVPPVRGELAIGWTAHYAIGVVFAAGLVLVVGASWFAEPAIVPAVLAGIVSVAAPFFVMQPAMGAGVAASRTPRPAAARLQSLVTHTLFGVGLFLAAVVVDRLRGV